MKTKNLHMCRLTFLILLVASITQADIWLTNGINPENIDLINDFTLDGVPDVKVWGGLILKNIGTEEEPAFELFAFGIRETNGNYISLNHARDNLYYTEQQMSGNIYTQITFYTMISPCIVEQTKQIPIRRWGNAIKDVNGDGYYDHIDYYNTGVTGPDNRLIYNAQVWYGIGSVDTKPVPTNTASEYVVHYCKDWSFRIDHLIDIDDDGYYEMLYNFSIPNKKLYTYVYKRIGETNWAFDDITEYVQCFADYDNDGFTDVMYINGRVQLCQPEPNCLIIIVLIAVGFLRRKRFAINDNFIY